MTLLERNGRRRAKAQMPGTATAERPRAAAARGAAGGGLAAAAALALGVAIAAGTGSTPLPATAQTQPASGAQTEARPPLVQGARPAGDPPAAADAPQRAIDVDPAQITADSLISRHQAQPRDPNKGPVTNMPLPRYVSLKGAEGNARRGPSLSHRIDWVFRHPGMPLRVVAEFGHWRRVEDQDGAGGWVHYSLLSGVRTAIVTTDMAELRARGDTNGTIIARAEAGAIVRLHECTRDWCRVSGEGAKGWVPKTSLWGVDAAETRD